MGYGGQVTVFRSDLFRFLPFQGRQHSWRGIWHSETPRHRAQVDANRALPPSNYQRLPVRQELPLRVWGVLVLQLRHEAESEVLTTVIGLPVVRGDTLSPPISDVNGTNFPVVESFGLMDFRRSGSVIFVRC